MPSQYYIALTFKGEPSFIYAEEIRPISHLQTSPFGLKPRRWDSADKARKWMGKRRWDSEYTVERWEG